MNSSRLIKHGFLAVTFGIAAISMVEATPSSDAVGSPVNRPAVGAVASGPSIQTTDEGYAYANTLKGSVYASNFNVAFLDCLDQALSEARQKNPTFKKLQEKLSKKSGKVAKVVSPVKGVLSEMLNIDCFGSSKTGARMALDAEKGLKVDEELLSLRLQQSLDEFHPQLIASILQFAASYGCGSADGQRESAEGLDVLIGPELSERLQNLMKDKKQEFAHKGARPFLCNDLVSTANLEKILIKAASADDPVITNSTEALSKMAHPGKAKTAFASLLENTLDGIAWIGPGFGIPAAAEATKAFVVLGTGGAEDDKLIDQITLLKKIMSRKKALTEEVHSCLYAWQLGSSQKNPLLVECSRTILMSLTTKNTVRTVCELSNGAVIEAAGATEKKGDNAHLQNQKD